MQAWRDDEDGRVVLRLLACVEDAFNSFSFSRLPMADAKGGQVSFVGETACHNEEVGQSVNRRQLGLRIDEDANLDGTAPGTHVSFGPHYVGGDNISARESEVVVSETALWRLSMPGGDHVQHVSSRITHWGHSFSGRERTSTGVSPG